MRAVGKTLGLVLLAGSLIAMLLATATRAAESPFSLEGQLKEFKARCVTLLERLEEVTEELAEEKAARRVDVVKLETELDALKRRLDQREHEFAKVVQSEREAIAVARATQEVTAAMRQENAALRAEVRKLQQERDEHLQQVVRLTDVLHDKVTRSRLLRTRTPPLPRGLEGRVVEVWGALLVEVSLGSDDGLLSGHRIEVRPTGGNAPPIQIEVIVAKFDKAICRVIGPVKTDMVKKGDWAGAAPDPFAKPSSPPEPDPFGDPPPKSEKNPFGEPLPKPEKDPFGEPLGSGTRPSQ